MIVQKWGGWGQGPFEHCVDEIAVLVEDGFPNWGHVQKKKKTYLTNSKGDDKKQRLETMGGDKHSMVAASWTLVNIIRLEVMTEQQQKQEQ